MALETFTAKLEPKRVARIKAEATELDIAPATLGRHLIELAQDGFIIPLDDVFNADVVARIESDAQKLGIPPAIYGRNLLIFALEQEDREGAELKALSTGVAGLNTHAKQLNRSFIDGVEAILLNLAAREDERMTVTDVTSLIDDFRRRLTEE